MTPGERPAHRWPVRVYYEDTDFSGVVYHASYLRFLERGRTEWLRTLGLLQSDLHRGESSAAFAVRRMTLDFRAPARMDDLLSVESHLSSLGGASIVMHQAVLRGATVLLEAEVRLGLVAAGRPLRLPPSVTARLASASRAEASA